MNYFCSLFNYANFSNIFSLCQKPYQKKQSPKKSLEGLLHVLRLSFLSLDFYRNNVGRKDFTALQQVASNRQTSHHNTHHAHQLDEDVQRRS